jgi:hypothetical protein
MELEDARNRIERNAPIERMAGRDPLRQRFDGCEKKPPDAHRPRKLLNPKGQIFLRRLSVF